MKNRLLPYYFLCTCVYVGLFLIEFLAVNYLIRIFTSNSIVSVTVFLPILLFVNPVLTWFAVESIIKNKK